MRALCLVCTLKRSPEPSNAESLADVVLEALRGEDVETETIRLADHRIDPRVVSRPGDEQGMTTDGREWSMPPGKAMASNRLAVARRLAASPIPAPPED